MRKVKIAILASGSGTNAENLGEYFANSGIEVGIVASNNSNAYVLERAKKLGIESLVFSKSQLMDGSLVEELKSGKIDYVILAGFLLKIPSSFISHFPNRILNIHPALLPNYGGKGMYGQHVHEAVVRNGEKFSGITIHLVNEEYDEGQVLFQEKTVLEPDETPDSLATKIHKLEYEFFPKIIEDYIESDQSRVSD